MDIWALANHCHTELTNLKWGGCQSMKKVYGWSSIFNKMRETLFNFVTNGNVMGHMTPMKPWMTLCAHKWCHFCRNPYKRSPRSLP